MAPDSFKGSASAIEVAVALKSGWLTVRPNDHVEVAPLADGGEGTLDTIAQSSEGSKRIPVRVVGPDGALVDAHWLLLADCSAVVELSNTSGIGLLPLPDPLHAHTRGLGQAIMAAISHGAPRIRIALGSSCSTDGGVGALRELGAEFLDDRGAPVQDGGVGLELIRHVSFDRCVLPPHAGVEVLVDVSNPLLGDRGAARTFAPQKGADPGAVRTLERGLTNLANLLTPDPALPGSGSAGGTGFGLAHWGARLVPGAEAVAEVVNFDRILNGANLVITGEGRFDLQSMDGKLPSFVLDAGRARGIPVALVAGSIRHPASPFSAQQSLEVLAGSVDSAMLEPQKWLTAAGRTLAYEFTKGWEP